MSHDFKLAVFYLVCFALFAVFAAHIVDQLTTFVDHVDSITAPIQVPNSTPVQ